MGHQELILHYPILRHIEVAWKKFLSYITNILHQLGMFRNCFEDILLGLGIMHVSGTKILSRFTCFISTLTNSKYFTFNVLNIVFQR